MAALSSPLKADYKGNVPLWLYRLNETLQQIVRLAKAAGKKGGANVMVTSCDRQADVVKTAPDAIDGGGLVLVDGTQLKGISSLN